MTRPTLVSRPWLAACAVLMIPLARETSGWLIPPAWSSARTCSRCKDVQHGGPLRPPALARVQARRPPALARVRARLALRNVALNASHDNSEAAGDDNAAGGGAAAGGASKAGAAASAPRHVDNKKGKQERVQAAEDSDAPIFYIKGLKEGGGVGVWGDDGSSSNDDDDDDAGDDVARARGGGNAAMMARALRNAEREIEGGGNYEEGVEDGGGVEEAADATPVWEKVQAALGLGVWSYVGLGLAVFIIALNNVLGVGWAAKFIDPDFDPDSVIDLQQQGRQIQYMPLDDTSNLLSD